MRKEKIFLLRPKSLSEEGNVHPRSCCLPWTLKYIQSILESRNYPVYFYDLKVAGSSLEEAIRLVRDYDPQYIVIQANTLECSSCKEILKRLKGLTKAKTILIGQYASYLDSSPAGVDFLVKGESEIAVSDLIINESNKAVDQEKTHLIDELSDLPFPRYRKEELKNYHYPYPIKIAKRITWGSILSSRGCPYDCIFCTQILRESYGKKIRLRNADNILAEIRYLKDLGANVISFEDDSFTFSSVQLNSVCDKLISENLGIKWICQGRVDELDYNILKKMKKAGCMLIRFGVESGSERIIKILKKTRDEKNWIEKTKEVFSRSRELGISTDAMFIIGSPSETQEDIFASIKLARSIRPDMLQVVFFTPYPGSEAFRIYRERFKNINTSQLYHYGKLITNLSCVDSEKLIELQKKFYRSIVFRPSFLINHMVNYLYFYIFNYKHIAKAINFKNFF